MKNTGFKKAIIYTRVSSEEQAKHDLSLPYQRDKCLEFAKNNGYIVLKEFEEPGRSGTTAFTRPALMEMYKFSIEQKIDAVIVHKTDRLARNMGDYWTLYNNWKLHGISIVSVAENFDNSPAGVFSMGVMSANAQYYSANLSLEVKKGHSAKIMKGIYPGFAPFGYENYGPEHDRRIRPITENIQPIKDAYNLFSTGDYSISRLTVEMQKREVKTKTGNSISRSIVGKMLRDPIYYGAFMWNNELHENAEHEAIITKELFDNVQFILNSRRVKGTRDHTHNFMLRGYVYCSCGVMLTGDKKTRTYKNGNTQDFIYFGCKNTNKNKPCSSTYIRMEDLEALILEMFKIFKFKDDYREYVIKTAKEIVGEVRESENDYKKQINQRISKIESKMRVAEDERLEQTITREDFSRIYIRLKEDLSVAQQDLLKLSDNHHKTIKVLDEVLALVENLYETYKTAPNDIKRTYLRMFIDKVLVDDKKIVEVKLTPIAQKLLEIEQVRISGEIRRGQDSNLRSYC